MKLYIKLIINRNVNGDSEKDVLAMTAANRLVKEILKKTPFIVERDFELKDDPVSFADYLPGKRGIKDLKKLCNVHANTYHIVYYAYDPKDEKDLYNWTFYDPESRTCYIQIPITSNRINEWRHETMHALVRITIQNRANIQDTMDYRWEGLSDEESDAKNVELHLALLSQCWDKIVEPQRIIIMKKIIVLSTALLDIIKGSSNDYTAFAKAMRKRESGDNYSIKNHYNFFGAYQFGMPRLSDLGITVLINGKLEWEKGYSERLFLSSPELQDRIFKQHVYGLKNGIENDIHQKDINQYTMSGLIAVAHLLGFGGMKKFVNGTDGQDALGTKGSEYQQLFKGYNI